MTLEEELQEQLTPLLTAYGKAFCTENTDARAYKELQKAKRDLLDFVKNKIEK